MSLYQRLIDIHHDFEDGYHPCVDYGEWRVATLCYLDELAVENLAAMERHNQTDEVFVLLRGRCILFLGDGDGRIEEIHPVDMLPRRVYNVKRGVYHTHTLSRDALVLIVENRDTGSANSDRVSLTEDDRKQLITMTKRLWE